MINIPQRGGHRSPICRTIIEAVLSIADQGTPQKAIAESFGISQPMVSNILTRHGQRRVFTRRQKMDT